MPFREASVQQQVKRQYGRTGHQSGSRPRSCHYNQGTWGTGMLEDAPIVPKPRLHACTWLAS